MLRNLFAQLTKANRGVQMAIRNLWLHKLRSFLSVLGIIIGAASVISLMGFGDGSMHDALEDIKKQGATNIIVMSVKPPDDANQQRRSFVAKYGLTDEDYQRFCQTIPTVTDALPLRMFAAEIRPVTESRLYNGRVVGTTPRYSVVYKLDGRLASGRFISDQDERPFPRNVVVLGSEVAKELFPGEDPINKTIKLSGKDRAFIVIGVLKDRAPNTSGAEIEKYNGDIYIPLTSCRALLGDIQFFRSSGSRGAEDVKLNQVILTVQEMDQVRGAADIVKAQLEQFHSARKDWDIKVPLDRLQEAERTQERYQKLTFFIGSITLLVGGIGIMNIMLATVTERTREIGIRRALGAKRMDIIIQFLVEAVVQTALGGIAGIGLGLLVIFAAPMLALQAWGLHIPARVNELSIYMAFGAALVVGVGAGLYPAMRAARLDPIEALRHE